MVLSRGMALMPSTVTPLLSINEMLMEAFLYVAVTVTLPAGIVNE